MLVPIGCKGLAVFWADDYYLTPLLVDPDQQRSEIKPGRLSTHWHHTHLGHQPQGVIFAPVLNNLAVRNAVNGH
jgi:hypothetical protein